jgi:hypothetical protein
MKKGEELDNIANLEKAIKNKYGDDVVKHPLSDWDDIKEEEYLEQIKKIRDKGGSSSRKVETDGFFVSEKLLNKNNNRVCPVCEVYSFNIADDVYMSKYECCEKCYIIWVEDREQRWEEGWRPPKGEKE